MDDLERSVTTLENLAATLAERQKALQMRVDNLILVVSRIIAAEPVALPASRPAISNEELN